MRPIPAWWWSWLYQAKKRRQKSLASSMQQKRSGNSGWYLRVLKWASENGLSLEVWGRLCDLVTPRSASIRAVAFMGPPAWRVSWPGGTACFSRVSSNSAWNRVGIGDAPADDPAAEDVENDVEIEVGPFRRSGQLRDIPRPDLIGAFGEQFGLGVDRVAQLVAPEPRHGRPGCGTGCGSSRGRRPRRAGWRRPPPGRDRRSAAHAAGRARPVVLRPSAHGAGWDGAPVRPGQAGAPGRWRATAPGRCRRRP